LPGADSVNFTGGNITWPWTTVATTSSERTGFDGSLGGDFVNLLDGATVHLQNAQYFAELVIGDDCTMVANPTISNDPSLSYLIRADLLNVFDGWLDLNNNDLLVDSPNVPFWYVRNLVASGRNGGDWLGTGITSTMARNHPDQSTTLGVMDAADWHALAGPNALFDGAPVDQDAVLVKYTWYGDTDFNGVVDFDDYVHADQGHNNGWSGWTNGDFDLNGQVDFDDYVFLDMGFNKQGELL
jgi:hypothetical protein